MTINNNISPRPQIKNIHDATLSRRFVRGMAGNSLAPVILLECFVTGGRTLQAHKRGGFIEARERLTEEAVGAGFWFAGVKCFNKINDKIGQHLLKLHETNFDVGQDAVRKPIDKFIQDANKYIGKLSQKNIKKVTPDIIARFKLTKVVSSILLANVLVGLVVPKINQGITKNLYKKQHEHDNDTSATKLNTMNPVSLESFLNKDKKDVTFKGMEKLLKLANNFENNDIYQLLSTDVGIAGGRALSARNNDERIEVLFRDLSSIFFYLFSMPLINKGLNLIIDGKPSRLDPVASKQTTTHLQNFLHANGGQMSIDDFATAVVGDSTNTGYMDKSLLKKLEKDNTMTLDAFLEHIRKDKNISFEKHKEFSQRAIKMSELQPARVRNLDIKNVTPIVKDGKILTAEKSGLKVLAKDNFAPIKILTHNEIKNAFRGGIINSPEFLKDIFFVATQDEVPFVKTKDGKAMNPYKYTDNASIDSLRNDIYHYADDIIKKAKSRAAKAIKAGKDEPLITMKTIQNACNENFVKNSLTWGAGFAISAIFLSSLIPKMQYWITKKRTGKDSFPGVAEYSSKKDTVDKK